MSSNEKEKFVSFRVSPDTFERWEAQRAKKRDTRTLQAWAKDVIEDWYWRQQEGMAEPIVLGGCDERLLRVFVRMCRAPRNATERMIVATIATFEE